MFHPQICFVVNRPGALKASRGRLQVHSCSADLFSNWISGELSSSVVGEIAASRRNARIRRAPAATYRADYHFSHSTRISAERWSDDVRLSDRERARRLLEMGRKSAYPSVNGYRNGPSASCPLSSR